ncbi:Endoplasmic reticulum transmembrane protein 3 [Yamadazyma tenuis]|uniref:Endoplasmic reticulum transmembrane protein n=1 Tax=Candida tenuis (strain ATCC 10573 / BCRC 21748 / CBS 615 / JCM 9827 / NBRC 10315 / NRRL Y-1498 / VKM Y-70) TaxID=590646 RepID=G3AWS5_CANTC|nr:B-cell receptor-associated 31-like protein [Yamadazyma tenuis ATCC 10573]EGV66603.1 B-cell receptor-associated 31-like protein [Yamadazyma tenuis ATCC 10573]WEJ95270.1 Endoplasmic reticulum transmembrane protein 3 [Yamadazyma tenuis]
MALYYNLVFGLLVVEVAFFTVLSLPYPRKIRRTVLTTVSAPFRNEKFQIALKCILGFVLVLFIDSVNRVASVSNELQGSAIRGSAIVNDRSEIQARRFYAQRNMYLCGFTLFLTLILLRTYSLVTELLVTKDKVDALTGESELGETETKDSPSIVKLKEELAAKDKELESLKEKAKALANDYEGDEDIKTKPATDDSDSKLRARKV